MAESPLVNREKRNFFQTAAPGRLHKNPMEFLFVKQIFINLLLFSCGGVKALKGRGDEHPSFEGTFLFHK